MFIWVHLFYWVVDEACINQQWNINPKYHAIKQQFQWNGWKDWWFNFRLPFIRAFISQLLLFSKRRLIYTTVCFCFRQCFSAGNDNEAVIWQTLVLTYGKQACNGVIMFLFILKLLVIYVGHTAYSYVFLNCRPY